MRWDFIYRGETQDLTDAVRSAAGGSFSHLSDGFTHYELNGSTDKAAVVLVHGFSAAYFIWDPTFEALTAAGFRPLRYDLFGRGYSDRPHVQYGLDLYVRQLEQLLHGLGLQQVDLVGLSMGGPIAAAFAVRHPGRVRKLMLVDPVGAKPVPLYARYRIAALPGLGELVLGLLGTEQIVGAVARGFFNRDRVGWFQEQYREQMRLRGFKRAILSSLRHHMLGTFAPIYEVLGRSGIPVMLVWGQNDDLVPVEHSRALLQLIPQASLHVMPGCGHIPHFERPGEFNPRLIDFLCQE
jgi:pimeloyl-ACP methyl ester carboxylesterase